MARIYSLYREKWDSLYFPPIDARSSSLPQVITLCSYPLYHLSKPCKIQSHPASYKVFPMNSTALALLPVQHSLTYSTLEINQ